MRFWLTRRCLLLLRDEIPFGSPCPSFLFVGLELPSGSRQTSRLLTCAGFGVAVEGVNRGSGSFGEIASDRLFRLAGRAVFGTCGCFALIDRPTTIGSATKPHMYVPQASTQPCLGLGTSTIGTSMHLEQLLAFNLQWELWSFFCNYQAFARLQEPFSFARSAKGKYKEGY